METNKFENIFSAVNKRIITNFWILNSLFWGFYSLIFLPYAYNVYGSNITKIFLAAMNVVFGFLVTLILRLIYKRININKISFFRLAVIIVVASFLGIFIWYRLDDLLRILIMGWEKGIKTKTLFSLFYEVTWNTPILLTWSFLYFAIKIWMAWNIQRDKVEKADALASKANLEMLRYQLNPHFIFNTLSSLRAMTLKDPVKAHDMITKISEFLRYTLADEAKNEVSLKEEIDAIKNYLEIEKIRLDNQLVVEYYVEPLAEEYPVPAFILNPIVENAIKHGVTHNSELKIIINAKVLPDKSLHLELCNTGVLNINESKNGGFNIGIANVKKRLSLLYPGNSSFTIKDNNGTVVTVINIKKLPVKILTEKKE